MFRALSATRTSWKISSRVWASLRRAGFILGLALAQRVQNWLAAGPGSGWSEVLRVDILNAMGLDPEEETPGRQVVRHIGESLVQAMEMALKSGDEEAAQLVAAESIVLAETKDHLNWHLIGETAKKSSGEVAKLLSEAHEKVEDEEDEHLYHTTGWARELWIKSMGIAAVLPPPEEVKKVETAIGAARAQQARAQML